MCGINGFSWRDERLLERMNTVTKSRGPDFAGTYFDEKLSLGHRLLAIREAWEASKQPFMDDPEWVLLFNGQIYNTTALSKEFGDLDPTRRDLDTYILYKVIEKYGWGFIERVQGMFAIALYNTKSQELRLYRDPSGQKQLYYYYKDGKFIFSSELKAILEYDIDKAVDSVAVGAAATIGYIPGEKTLFKYVSKLNASEFLTWKYDSTEPARAFYKSPSNDYFSPSPDKAFEELVEEHLQAKYKVALNLSGGLDSSILLHEMSKSGREAHTYTTRFEGLNNSVYNRDADLAKRLAEDYGSSHREISISKETYLKNFVDSYALIEEPNFNISLPVYLETAKTEGIHGNGNRVILSGDGGDEVFGGYPHYIEALRLSKLSGKYTSFVLNMVKNWRAGTDFDYSDSTERWLASRELRWRAVDKTGASLKYIKDTADTLSNLCRYKSGPVYETMLRDRYLWMPSENFIRSDKLYMSQSLEMRSPFAFEPFRRYMDSLLKEDDYVAEDSNKVFLRNLYKGKLPDYIVERKDKTGWRSPVKEWYDDDFKKMFLEILEPMRNKKNLIDWDKVYRRVAEGQSWPGKEIHLYLSLAILCQRYKIEI